MRRRTLLKAAAGGLLAGAAPTGPAGAVTAAAGAAPGGATLAATLVPLAPNPLGYQPIGLGAGEPTVVRVDLGVRARPGRVRRRRSLACFVQLTDVHLLDAQTPLRLDFLDRFGDPDPVLGTRAERVSRHRPQDPFTAHVAEAMVRAVNRLGRGPVTRRRVDLVAQTGDATTYTQLNELGWNLTIMNGGRVLPSSGDPAVWEGVQAADARWYDPAYWHPDGTPPGAVDDVPRARYGFPLRPGVLEAAQRPFEAEGLRAPWVALLGNHDVSEPDHLRLGDANRVATGRLKMVTPPEGVTPRQLITAVRSDFPGFLAAHEDHPGVRPVTEDLDRRVLSRAEVVQAHLAARGTPAGHGLADAPRTGAGYYTVDIGRVRLVALDTANPAGGAGGCLDEEQAEWLRRTLARSLDRVVVLLSHHPLGSLDNRRGQAGRVGGRLGTEQVRTLVLGFPNVVAWFNGHTHRNLVTPVRRWGGAGGFWEVTTSSLVGWPQQARVVEVVDNRDGTLSVITTMLDHAAPPAPDAAEDDLLHLAALSREVAFNDWQRDRTRPSGTPADRNVELLVRIPPYLR